MEEGSSSEDEEITTMHAIIDRKQFASTAPALPPLPPTPDMVIVKKNYDPKLGNLSCFNFSGSYLERFEFVKIVDNFEVFEGDMHYY